MNEEFSGKMPASGDLNECLGLLKNLDREEILEILCGGGDGFCSDCQTLLHKRIQGFINKKNVQSSESNGLSDSEDFWSSSSSTLSSVDQSSKYSTGTSSRTWTQTPVLGTRRAYAYPSPASINSKQPSSRPLSSSEDGLSEDQNEHMRCAKVGRKKNFNHVDRIDGKKINVLQGIELHTGVFDAEEQKKIVDAVYNLQRMGQRHQLRERTYLEPRKWMRGKGRVTIQFGCCYNYAKDKHGNPPGIIRDEEVDPLPSLFKQMIKRMVRWHVLPPTCVPDSCIVNIYDAGDCIPPHIDHNDFLRPFCTVSFLTECNILFGANLKVVDEGVFDGPVSIPLPVGSVLILNGNGADIAKHCVPGVPGKRISITFRKMDDRKLPNKYSPDPDLIDIKPLVRSLSTKPEVQQSQLEDKRTIPREPARVAVKASAGPLFNDKDDFPALGSSILRANGNGRRR